ncbi:NupC/NupG family nucleoside CNT transporter [Deferrisoma camini]|uniref:NupC/NupG family nucleoside CNT transporter n=1 Tax=Deferrisoma camini TaxID=1035120 RepID=UPI0004A384C7
MGGGFVAIRSALGLVVLCALAWGLGENRRAVRWRTVAVGVGLQVAIALVLLKLPPSKGLFLALNRAMDALQEATRAGTSFVFGYLGGAPLPFQEVSAGGSFVLAFQALPIVLVMSALSAVLFHWRVVPWVVRGFSWLLERTLGVGGAVGLSAAANVFVGMVEAPLLVRPYLERMGRGELFMVMTAGMATIAGTVLALYASILGPVLPDAIGHILTASLISAPAAVVAAHLMVPETGEPTGGGLAPPDDYASTMDAVTKGTLAGLGLLLNIVAMLVVLVALVSLVNQALGLLPPVGGEPITMERILGFVLAPVMWLIGIPWSEAVTAGSLMGTKTVLNEFLAYLRLAQLPAEALSDRGRLIVTYALCGFANFGSLGILIGGMGALVPSRRDEIVALGLRSIVSGTLATLMTGAVVGMLTA